MPETALESELCIILNPNAAKGKALSHRTEIEAFFLQAGIPISMELTTRPFEAIDFAHKAVASGYKTIIAAGGDGTMNEVVDGVIRATREMKLSHEEAPVVGLIPIGRGNDFAFFAGIPNSVGAACQLIADRIWSSIDYGEVFGGRFPEGRCFVNGVGIGFEPMVNFVASDFKRVSGMLSYLLGFLKVWVHYPSAIRLHFESEQGSFYCDTQQVSLCNGRRMGSTFIMGPYAELDDGLLDIVYANKPIKWGEILRYAIKFFSGSQLKTDRFSMFRAQRITITSDSNNLVCHTDGEEVSRGCNQIGVTLYPSGLKCIRKIQS
jgi:YegS/Rv2252/BmrU family lipid kinase